ncbi:MAG TPA: hypothetical protein VIK03_00955, partial [Thermoleophilia bacterium]
MDRTSRKPALALIVVLALSFATLALAACGGSSSSSSSSSPAASPFKVGLAAPFTGDYATYGASHQAGA